MNNFIEPNCKIVDYLKYKHMMFLFENTNKLVWFWHKVRPILTRFHSCVFKYRWYTNKIVIAAVCVFFVCDVLDVIVMASSYHWNTVIVCVQNVYIYLCDWFIRVVFVHVKWHCFFFSKMCMVSKWAAFHYNHLFGRNAHNLPLSVLWMWMSMLWTNV